MDFFFIHINRIYFSSVFLFTCPHEFHFLDERMANVIIYDLYGLSFLQVSFEVLTSFPLRIA